jgi:hypothetical protein
VLQQSSNALVARRAHEFNFDDLLIDSILVGTIEKVPTDE